MSSLALISADWPALNALLDEALDLQPDDRAAWLAGLMGANAAHRPTLHALLATQGEIETGDFLADLPPLPLESALHSGAAPGAIVGPYRLISQIGQGGMASVWLAERADGLIKRQVALKLPAVAWGEAFSTRLARERDILASLTHEHIARLYDAGVDAHGRPYLAMEVIEGEPIDVFCRERQLPLAERIDLLLQVMAAVAHAHARLVVHRDLKPSNILVSADARVSLLDFGIAKLLEGDLTEDTALTRAAGHALTPDYASPEQIRGEPLGTASDIYSLAVVAYGMLAGGRPYRLKRAGAAELADAIAAADIPLASDTAGDQALKRQLRGDLDAILNKALKKRADERYPTMDAFAQDLRRWRDDEPVQARPDGLGYRALKFVARYRLQVAAGAVVTVALVAGTAVALWQAHEARVQARRAQAEADTAKAVQGFLEGVFQTSSADQADPVKARQTTARELLDRGAERIDADLRAQPAAKIRMLDVLASIYGSMALADRQVALRRQQLSEARSLWGPESDESVSAMAHLADALTAAQQRTEAASLLRAAGATLDARHDGESRTRFWVEVMQASLDRYIDPRHGLVASGRALAIARRYPPDAALLQALQLRGENANFLGDYEEARLAFAEKVRLSKQHPPLGASDLCEAYGSLAEALAGLGQFARAEAVQRQAMEIALRRSEPARLHYAETQLAILFFNTGRFRESLQATEPAWRWAHSSEAAAFPEAALMIELHYAATLAYYGRAREALAETDHHPALTAGPESVSTVDLTVLGIRSFALTELGRLDEARALQDRARSLLQHGNDKLSSSWTKVAETRWLVASGRAAEALAAYQAANAAELASASAPVVVLNAAAGLSLEAGDAAAAEALATRALAALSAAGQADYQRDSEASATLVLGRALLRQQHAAQALPVLRKAVELNRAVYDPQRGTRVATACLALADAQRAVGDTGAAVSEVAGRSVLAAAR